MVSTSDKTSVDMLLGSIGADAPKSFLGGNLEVYSALDSIQFQGVLGDASMRGNTAYITLWKRGGTRQQSSEVDVNGGQNTPATDQQEELYSGFKNAFSDTTAFQYDNSLLAQTWPSKMYSGWVNSPVNFNSEISPETNTLLTSVNYVSPDLANFTDRLANISQQTPKSRDRSAINTALTTGQKLSANTNFFSNFLGQVFKSANPNGSLYYNRRILEPYSTAPGQKKYSGGAANASTDNPFVGRVDKATSTMTGEMMWQFLFNPSELELDVGPEFKNAETWGVSDKANSGQPLHWSNNKNAELKFNSVLLNGFVFGKKVEALEQGLIELFMARDGQGQHGPHVLEFVWGKRRFGPCVIKNVNIKEKMWDEGLVVNAELSFTLEQVPEWTINDGFVDVARPGRLPVEADPAQPSSNTSTQNPTATTITEDNTGPGASNSPDQKPRPTRTRPTAPRKPTQLQCQNAQKSIQGFSTLINSTNVTINTNVGWARTFIPANLPGSFSEREVINFANDYARYYAPFSSVLNRSTKLQQTCKDKCSYRGRAAQTNRTTLACFYTCAQEAKRVLEQEFKLC